MNSFACCIPRNLDRPYGVRPKAEKRPAALLGRSVFRITGLTLVILLISCGDQSRTVEESLEDRAFELKLKGDYEGSELLYRRALTRYEEKLGATHYHVGGVLFSLGELHFDAGSYALAEAYYRQALLIARINQGADSMSESTILEELAGICIDTGRKEEADELTEKSAAIQAMDR